MPPNPIDPGEDEGKPDADAEPGTSQSGAPRSRSALASRIDAMLAAGALDEDLVDDGDDEAKTGVLDPQHLDTMDMVTGVRDAPVGAVPELVTEVEVEDPAAPDVVVDADAVIETEAVEELSADDVSLDETSSVGGPAAVHAPAAEPPGRPSRPVITVPTNLPRSGTVIGPPPPAPPPRVPAIPPKIPIPRAMPPVVPRIPVPAVSSLPPRPVVRVPPLAEMPTSPGSAAPPPAPARPKSPTEPPAVAEVLQSIEIAEDDEAHRPPPLEDQVAAVAELGEENRAAIVVAADDSPSEAVVTPDVELHAQLTSPSAIEQALADLGESSHERRAAELARDAEAATERAQIGALHYELGELYERRLADEARAVKAFGKALSTDPSLKPNLWAIRRIFYRRGLWPNLLKLIDAELRFAKIDVEKADLHLEKGFILRDHLDNAGDARVALEEAARLDERNLAARVALERMALADGDLARAAVLWGELAEAARAPARKLVHLLELCRYHSEQGPAGLDRARELITEAVALGVDVDRVAEERLRLAELSGSIVDSADEVLAALEAQAALVLASTGPAGLPEPLSPHGRAPGTPLDRATAIRLRLAAIRRRQAGVARAAKLGERAWDYLQRAVAVAPGEPLLLADLADLAEELGRFEELAELVQSWQSLEGDPARAVTLSIRRADALLRGGQRDAARSLLASLEATTPGFLPLTALAERDALGAGDWAELASAWNRAADAARLGTALGPGVNEAEPALAASLYVAAAEVWVHDVGTEAALDEARSALGRALEVVRGYPPAIEALVELHERAGRIDDAAAVLELQADSPASADIDTRVSVLGRLARLYRDHGQHEQALGAELKLRRLLPDDVRLMWQVDVTLAQLGGPDRPDRMAERIANLQAIAARDPDPARRGIALSTAARLAEDAGDRDRAIELYRKVLAVWPGDAYARAALVELLRMQERWDDLVSARRAEAEEVGDAGVVRALREAAWVLEERLGRPADAAQVYRTLLDRVPDEPSASLGLIRCRAAAGDALGLVAALEGRLETMVDSNAPPAAIAAAAVTLATAHEGAGRVDDAVDAYRRALTVGGSPSAIAIAALALADVAAARGDTASRAEAYDALAGATASPALAAALHEDLGWLHALVLEDFDGAAASFGKAQAADPHANARGPLFGGLLVAARRADLPALATATGSLADGATTPSVAAALHLRAAALTSAVMSTGGELGPLAPPAARIARARAIAPEDRGALVVAAEHAPPAMPPRAGAGPDDIAFTVDVLLARAEMLGERAALAEDPVARASWELDRAEALEATGRLKESGEVVAGVLRNQPGELRALEAMRRLARRGNDPSTFARATVTLARRMIDPQGRIETLREAAAILDPNQGDPARRGVDAEAAVAVYRRILADDPGAPDFDRLVVLYRNAGDLRGLHTAIDERMAWNERAGHDPKTSVPLLLERARLRRAAGNLRGAVADLRELIRREPGHTDALRLAAELVGGMGDAPGAVDLWRRYLAVESLAERRSAGELALAKVLAEQMGDAEGAILELERVVAATPDDPQLRERLIGLATRTGDWAKVARELRELARLRPTSADRAREELRLAEVQRDKLGDRASARATLERARPYDRFSLEIIEPLVALTDDPGGRARLLADLTGELRGAIEQAPSRAMFYERLAAIASWQGDRDLAYWSACAVEALGVPNAEQRDLLAAGRAAGPPPVRGALDPQRRALLRPPFAAHPLGEVWRAVAAAVTQVQGLDPAKLGFARGDKLAQKALGKRYEPLAAALALLGLDGVDVYVNDTRKGIARVLSAETPIVCVGSDVASGATPQARYWLGRVAMLAADATGTLAELKDAEVVWYLAAAARAAEIHVPAGLVELVGADVSAVEERAKFLVKALSRRDKKALTTIAPQLARVGTAAEVVSWQRAALASAHRTGVFFAGDLAPALAALDTRGARAIGDSWAAVDLLGWSVSPAHLELRRSLIAPAPAGGRR